MPQGGVDLTLAVGSTTYDLMVARDDKGNALFKRFPAPPLNPVVNQSSDLSYGSSNPVEGIPVSLGPWDRGCGLFAEDPKHPEKLVGRYALGASVDCRWGMAMPGPRVVADMAGIAANFREVKRVLHAGVNWIACTDNTDTKIYKVVAGAWVQQLDVFTTFGVHVVCTDMVSFRGTNTASAANVGVLAVGFGTSQAFVTTIDNGANWVASTKAGNGKYATFFTTVQYGTETPRCWYCLDPGDLYSTTDLTNTGTSAGPTTIGDTGNDSFTSIILDDTGVLLIGKRQYLYTLDGGKTVRVVDGPRRYLAGTSDAGTGAGLANYATPTIIEGRVYYPLEDYTILEYDHGTLNENLSLNRWGPQIGRMQLPLNALCAANGWLVVALGTSSTTLLNFAQAAAYDSDLAVSVLVFNEPTQASDLYFGRYQEGPQGREWVWHGVVIQATVLCRGLWYDDTSHYLYLAVAGTATVNNMQKRAWVPSTNPLMHALSGTVTLHTGLWTLEPPKLVQGFPFVNKTLRRFTAQVGRGLTTIGAGPYLTVAYRVATDSVGNDYSALTTITSSSADTDVAFPASATGKAWRVIIQGNGNSSNNTYAVLYSAQVTVLFYPPVMDMFQFTIKATNGQMNLTGAAGAMSWKAIRDAIDAMKDATTPATLTDVETGESWSVRMEPNGGMEENGLGDQRSITVTLHEVQ